LNSPFPPSVILSGAKDLHSAGRAKGPRGLPAAARRISFGPAALRMTGKLATSSLVILSGAKDLHGTSHAKGRGGLRSQRKGRLPESRSSQGRAAPWPCREEIASSPCGLLAMTLRRIPLPIPPRNRRGGAPHPAPFYPVRPSIAKSPARRMTWRA